MQTKARQPCRAVPGSTPQTSGAPAFALSQPDRRASHELVRSLPPEEPGLDSELARARVSQQTRQQAAGGSGFWPLDLYSQKTQQTCLTALVAVRVRVSEAARALPQRPAPSWRGEPICQSRSRIAALPVR